MSEIESGIPRLPECVPAKGNAFSRWLGRALLKLLGWKVTGEFPMAPKVMVALAPHTSNWDFVVAMAAILATGIDAKYLMKKEAFIWPLSYLWVWLGGVPLDRTASENTVEQLVQKFERSDKLWVAIAPEGTRNKVEQWKTGFLRIATAAQIPVMVVAWDYPTKSIVLDRLWHLSGDIPSDVAAIRQHARSQFQGRHPQKQ